VSPFSADLTARRSLSAVSKVQPASRSVFRRSSVRSPVEMRTLYKSCQALSRSFSPT
jgi:hypothetical protein